MLFLCFRPKKFTLKNFKRFYCVFREYTISLYKSKDDICGNPISKIMTKGKRKIFCYRSVHESFFVKYLYMNLFFFFFFFNFFTYLCMNHFFVTLFKQFFFFKHLLTY